MFHTLQDYLFQNLLPVLFVRLNFSVLQQLRSCTESQRTLDDQKAIAIDFGIDNLTTCATSTGQSFIIDGRRLKSINQWYNKENSRLQSIKDKQKFGKKCTNRQNELAHKRNNRVNDYMSKTARKIINYCLAKNIGVLVCGYNVTFQRESTLGKVTHQNFVNIPFGKLRDKLQYLCELYGIKYIEQEESYTSKASFWDKDEIPVFQSKLKPSGNSLGANAASPTGIEPANFRLGECRNDDNPKQYTFSGKRIHRGLYKTASGYKFNADVNGALNILRKSKVVSLLGLYCRGELDTPIRIRVA